MREEWRDVIGYEGRYRVSSLGLIASLICSRGNRKIPLILSPKINKEGYLALVFSNGDGTYKYPLVHQVVCAAFNGPRGNYALCRHLDGNSLNNVPSNLAWGSHKDNKADSIRHLTHARGESCGQSRLTNTQIMEIRNAKGTQQSIANVYGVAQSCISKIKSGHTWRSLGRS